MNSFAERSRVLAILKKSPTAEILSNLFCACDLIQNVILLVAPLPAATAAEVNY
jgi:hypothetical protein